MSRQKVSVVMIARNEAHNLKRAIESVQWADEICIADTGSTDDTYEIAIGLGVKVSKIKFEGFGPTKQKAVEMASNIWVLSLDCDEAVTPELKQSILSFLENTSDYAAAEFNRITNFCGKWIKHSGWYPEYILRLFDKDKTGFNDKLVHESVICTGKIARLEGNLRHFSYPDLKNFTTRAREYALLNARQKKDTPAIINLLNLLVKPILTFFNKLIIKRGFLDGFAGFKIACMAACGQILRYYYALTYKKRD
jgi:glycosyltransferase involved in cell wall biosynthesis